MYHKYAFYHLSSIVMVACVENWSLPVYFFHRVGGTESLQHKPCIDEFGLSLYDCSISSQKPSGPMEA